MVDTGPDPLAPEFIPRSKNDLERVEALERHVAKHGFDGPVLAQLPALIAWLADPHWEVARPIGQLLARAGNCLDAPIRSVLRGGEASDHFGLLLLLLSNLPISSLGLWEDELKSIVERGDEQGAAKLADELLARLQSK